MIALRKAAEEILRCGVLARQSAEDFVTAMERMTQRRLQNIEDGRRAKRTSAGQNGGAGALASVAPEATGGVGCVPPESMGRIFGGPGYNA